MMLEGSQTFQYDEEFLCIKKRYFIHFVVEAKNLFFSKEIGLFSTLKVK